ncbi:MAG: patatin family protein [Muribaculaceae bacterium]|nr:patatin family protein [Muribaculaceae bacterium]
MKTGLVLEGGSYRGMFTCGILDVFLREGITFDGMMGVSAGVAFGCNFKSRQLGRAIRYNTKLCHDWRYSGLRSLIKTGDIFGGEFCYHYVPRHIDVFDFEAYDSNPMPMWAVCMDVETGQPVYHRCDKAGDECFEWIRASASMPMVSRVVEVGGYRLLDGGMVDSIPLVKMEQLGHERNVVILTQPDGYVKKPNKLMPLVRVVMRKYPHVVNAMQNRHVGYNQALEYVKKQQAAGNVFAIYPDEPLNIGHVEHDPDEMRRVYDLGVAKAEQLLPSLRAWLAGEPITEK